tara:strand:+ start:703 stop:2067 length:1365 start_codon:yes stop_codon:yes gene_type:complete
MKILLVCSFFPPDNHVGANRWAIIASELHKNGHQLLILAAERRGRAKSHQSLGSPPLGIGIPQMRVFLPTRLSWERRAARVTRWLGSQARKQRNNAGSSEQHHSRSVECGISEGAVRKKPWCYPDHEASWRWATKAVSKSRSRIRDFSPDVIVATHPYLGCLRVGHTLSKELKIPWIADLRDPIHNDHQLKSKSLSLLLESDERILLSSASRVIAINEQLARMLLTDKVVDIVPQSYVPRKVHISNQSVAADRSNDVVRLLYTGSIQDECLYREFFDWILNAGSEMSSVRACSSLQIEYCGPHFNRIARYCSPLVERGIRLMSHGNLPHAKCLEMQEKADALVVFGWRNASGDCVMTGKLFDYMSAARPVIAIASKGTALAATVAETGIGVCIGTQDAMSKLLCGGASGLRKKLRAVALARQPDSCARYSPQRNAELYEAILADSVRISPTYAD